MMKAGPANHSEPKYPLRLCKDPRHICTHIQTLKQFPMTQMPHTPHHETGDRQRSSAHPKTTGQPLATHTHTQVVHSHHTASVHYYTY